MYNGKLNKLIKKQAADAACFCLNPRATGRSYSWRYMICMV